MRKYLVATTLVAALSASLAAQSCSNLTATGNGAPGTSVVLALTGAPANAFTAVAIGDTLGTTTLNIGPLGTLTLGLAQPFVPLPMGLTNAAGEASRTINVPNSPSLPGIDLYGQAVSMTWAMQVPGPGNPGPGGPHASILTLTFCTSNVVSFHLGN